MNMHINGFSRAKLKQNVIVGMYSNSNDNNV